jgi:hypothetical protein
VAIGEQWYRSRGDPWVEVGQTSDYWTLLLVTGGCWRSSLDGLDLIIVGACSSEVAASENCG